MLGYKVTQSDGADGDEYEIERLQVRPRFPLSVHECTEEDVDHSDRDGD